VRTSVWPWGFFTARRSPPRANSKTLTSACVNTVVSLGLCSNRTLTGKKLLYLGLCQLFRVARLVITLANINENGEMILHKEKFQEFIIAKGVGRNDKVADSVKSYVSYLNSISRHLNIEVTPNTIKTPENIQNICLKLSGKVSEKTINNYRSAMKHYIEMVESFNL
jgi:hypothetical protein